MTRRNNVVPNGHFHKNWQEYVKAKLNQPGKKRRHSRLRTIKARKMAPRPIELLRPVVRYSSVHYHTKLRVGRGFTLQELKAAGINKRYARSISIAVDYRRRNKCLESLEKNVARLKKYLAKMVVYPSGKKKLQETIKPKKPVIKGVNVVKPPKKSCKARVPTEEELEFEAYNTLRNACLEPKEIRREYLRKVAREGPIKKVYFAI